MISKSTLVADSATKEGVMPDLAETWTTRYPHRVGKTKIGEYVVPSNKTAKIKGIFPFGQFASIMAQQAFAAIDLGTVYFQVDGATKAEFRMQFNGCYFTAMLGKTGFDYGRRSWYLFNGVNFTSGQVIRIVANPSLIAGQGVPQTLWTASFTGKDTTTGASIIESARVITNTNDANQIILTYTAPANGFTLRNVHLQAMVQDYVMGHLQLRLNGLVMAEYPLIDTAFRTVTSRGLRGIWMLHDGINLNHGDKIEAFIDPQISVGQKFNFNIWGTESDEGGGVSSKIKRWDGNQWVQCNDRKVWDGLQWKSI